MFDASLLEGKLALVTMSTFGIGAETARRLAEAGAQAVVINGRDEAVGKAFAASLRERSPRTRFEFVAADITDPLQTEHLFRTIETELGGLDIMVHSGTGPGVPNLFVDMPSSLYGPLVNGLFLSLVHCCRHAVPMMISRGGGAIVSIASDAARVPTPGEAVMGAALAASVQFTRALALETARNQVRANVVAPSLVRDTKGYERVMSEPFSRKLFEKIQKRAEQRLGLPGPENLAPLAVFLASPLASHITGQVVTVNGGLAG